MSGSDGLLQQLTKALVERAMQAELTYHLGYEEHSPEGNNSGSSRNDKSNKTVKGEFGTLPIDVTRDRQYSSEPQIVPNGKTRFEGFDYRMLRFLS